MTVQSDFFCCCNFLGYLGVCETLHRRSQSRCHLSQFHTVCPLLSQSLVFLMISDDFSFRTRMGPQVTSSTPIRIPRCPQMAPRGPFWVTLGSLGITFCPLGLLLGASWASLGLSWGSLGSSWVRLGSSWAYLGHLWAPSGVLLGSLGCYVVSVGVQGYHLY